MAALFLRKVAREYKIPFDELRDSVLCEFTYEQLEDLDPDRETEHFNRFVEQHDFKKVNDGTVVLYLKGVKLAVSNSDLAFDLEDANIKLILIKRDCVCYRPRVSWFFIFALKNNLVYKMASIAMMIGGAVINAAAFTGGNYLARYLSGDNASAEKTRHDKAIEAFEAAQARYSHERTKLLDWIETNHENKELAKQNFTNTDYAFKLYNQAHPDRKMTLPKEPKFSDFYQPSEAQKQGELLFVGGSALALGYAAFRFLL